MAEEKQQWHLDKKVPVSIIVVIVLQIIAGAWSIATVTATLNETVRRVEVLEADRNANRLDSLRTSDRLARIEERLEGQNAILKRIERLLDKRDNEQ